MHRAIQITEVAKTWEEAYGMLRGLAAQDGWIGGRLISPSAAKPGWHVQGFVEDNPHAGDMWLPDGCRRVFVPDGMWSQITIAIDAMIERPLFEQNQYEGVS